MSRGVRRSYAPVRRSGRLLFLVVCCFFVTPWPPPAARGEGDAMVKARTELVFSGSGAAVLALRPDTGLRLYDLPGGSLRRQRSPVGVTRLALSFGGSCLALATADGGLEIACKNEEPVRCPLPAGDGALQALAVSDDGARVVLVRVTPATPDGAGGGSRLELWALPAGEAPLAAAPLPITRVAGLEADGELRLLTVHEPTTRGAGFRAAFALDATRGAWETVLREEATAPARVPRGIHAGRAWLADAEGLVGYAPSAPPRRLPGTLRDRLAASPDGARLLAYRTERMVGAVDGEVLLRLLDPNEGTELRRATRTVEAVAETSFALTADGALYSVQPTPEGGVAVRPHPW